MSKEVLMSRRPAAMDTIDATRCYTVDANIVFGQFHRQADGNGGYAPLGGRIGHTVDTAGGD